MLLFTCAVNALEAFLTPLEQIHDLDKEVSVEFTVLDCGCRSLRFSVSAGWDKHGNFFAPVITPIVGKGTSMDEMFKDVDTKRAWMLLCKYFPAYWAEQRHRTRCTKQFSLLVREMMGLFVIDVIHKKLNENIFIV